MGRPKASLPIAGSTLLGRAVDMLIGCTNPVLIVARSDHDALPPLPIESERAFDLEPDQGPLSGIRDGLRWHAARKECDAVLVMGCDMPFLGSAAVGWLASQLGDADLAVPAPGGVAQPLAAVYSLRTLPAVEKLLREGERAPKALIDRVKTRILTEADVRAFDPSCAFLRSIDTPEQYEAARRELGA